MGENYKLIIIDVEIGDRTRKFRPKKFLICLKGHVIVFKMLGKGRSISPLVEITTEKMFFFLAL